MRKLVLGSLVAVLLSGCATAHQQTEQEKALVGDWICHVKPAAKSPLPVEHFDYIVRIKRCFYVAFHRLIQKKAGCVIYCKLKPNGRRMMAS